MASLSALLLDLLLQAWRSCAGNPSACAPLNRSPSSVLEPSRLSNAANHILDLAGSRCRTCRTCRGFSPFLLLFRRPCLLCLLSLLCLHGLLWTPAVLAFVGTFFLFRKAVCSSSASKCSAYCSTVAWFGTESTCSVLLANETRKVNSRFASKTFFVSFVSPRIRMLESGRVNPTSPARRRHLTHRLKPLTASATD